MTPTFRVYPHRTTIILTLIALALAILSFMLEAYEWSLGTNNTYWAFEASDLFNVTYEGNIPTWYSTLLLLLAALVSLLIAAEAVQNKRRWRIHWTGLSLLFLYLSVDEAAAIHEAFTTPMRESFNTSGHLYFAWMLVGLPVALVVGALFLPFVLNLPGRVRLVFVLAGVAYLAGALGVEAIGANMYSLNEGIVTPLYTAVGGVEEFLEMFGVILALYGLLLYLTDHIGAIQFQFGPTPHETEKP